MSATPSSAPVEAPKVPIPAPAEKITLEAKDKLAHFIKELNIPESESNKEELAAIKKKFEENKDAVVTVSKTSLESLRKDIHDSDEAITGKLEVKDGELIHTEVAADSAPTTSEATPTEPATPEESVDLLEQMERGPLQQVPESYQKEVKNHIVNNGGFAGMVMKGLSNWVTEIIKGIKGFFATFGIEDEGEKKDALAQINGFEDAEEERRVTSSVKALKTSPVTKGPPLSDLLKISHISNEELTKILKDNPGLDFSSTKNIEAAFTGKYKHSGDREPMKRYDRIFINLTDIHDNLDTSEPYNATNKFKDILAGSEKTDLDIRIPERESVTATAVTAPIGAPVEEVSTSPEVQTQDLIEARQLDADRQKSQNELDAAKSISPATEESKKKVLEAETALKSSQEKMENLKKYEKGIMLAALEDTNRELETLKAQKTVLESKEPKNPREITENQTQIDFYEKNKAGITEKINSVMTTDDSNTEKWNFQDTKTASDIVTARISIQGVIAGVPIRITENDHLENQKATEAEIQKEWQELNNEFTQNIYTEETKIDNPESIKKMQDAMKSFRDKHPGGKKYEPEIATMEEKLLKSLGKIELIASFKKKIASLRKDENEDIDYEEDETDLKALDWLEIEGGKIQIDTKDNNGWNGLSSLADENWLDTEDKIIVNVGGAEKAIRILFANTSILRDSKPFTGKNGKDFWILAK